MSGYIKQGGEWLASVRSWIKRNCINGSSIIYGSNEVLRPHMTAKQVEEVAAKAVDVVFPEVDALKKENSELKMQLFAVSGTSGLRTNLSEILDKCGYDGWDGYEAKSINLATALVVMEFLTKLDEHRPIPEIVPEPSGSIGLEWVTGKQSLVVSISGTRSISFAGSYSDGELRGSEQFDETFPPSISAAFDRFFKDR